jgi:hypothetical protein
MNKYVFLNIVFKNNYFFVIEEQVLDTSAGKQLPCAATDV